MVIDNWAGGTGSTGNTENVLKTRIIHKHDTAENWAKATGFTPKEGELIVYEADADNTVPRLKVGDGTNNVNDLPFVAEALTADDIDEVCTDILLDNATALLSEIDEMIGG